MKYIDEPLNEELLEILNDFSTWFLDGNEQVYNKVHVDGKPDENEYHTGDEYLKYMMDKHDKKMVDGFPEVTHGMNLQHVESTFKVNQHRKRFSKIEQDMVAYMGARNCAVFMYYPTNGYMGWHHNANAHGLNLLLSYTKNGNGWFRYRDPITEEIITMEDKPGWGAKVGYYGKWDEPDKIYWHCARTYEPRLTMGFIIPNNDMWEMMKEALIEG